MIDGSENHENTFDLQKKSNINFTEMSDIHGRKNIMCITINRVNIFLISSEVCSVIKFTMSHYNTFIIVLKKTEIFQFLELEPKTMF